LKVHPSLLFGPSWLIACSLMGTYKVMVWFIINKFDLLNSKSNLYKILRMHLVTPARSHPSFSAKKRSTS